jgi:hypothetical protein
MATVRVTEKTRAVLRALARERDVPIHEAVERAVELYRRQQVLEATNAAYAALRADSPAWQELEEERGIWDVTLADGLEEA